MFGQGKAFNVDIHRCLIEFFLFLIKITSEKIAHLTFLYTLRGKKIVHRRVVRHSKEHEIPLKNNLSTIFVKGTLYEFFSL